VVKDQISREEGAVMRVSRVELFGEVLLCLDILAGDGEHSDSEEMQKVGLRIREILMPFITDEQARAVLEEWGG
jgi:hypothetical protein